jgi:hypothetical protein
MTTAMTLQFWGVRGSIPTPGPTTVRYGGNTACVSVELGHGTLLVLDAGTGIRPLGEHVAVGSPLIASRRCVAPAPAWLQRPGITTIGQASTLMHNRRKHALAR